MDRRWIWIVAGCAGLGAWTGGAGEVDAQSARVASFAGHRVLEDPSDVFMFPGLLFDHSDRLDFDYEPTATNGGGGLTFGADRIVGVRVGRGMLRHHPRALVAPSAALQPDHERFAQVIQRAENGVSPPVDIRDPLAPQMMADVLFGLPSGIGARLSIANSIDDEIRVAGGGEAADPAVCGQDETGTEFRTIELGGGWSQRTPSRSVDVGAAVSMHTVKSVNRGCLAAEAVGSPSLAAAARVAFAMTDRYELAVLAGLQVRDYGMEFSQLAAEVAKSDFGLTVGAGPRLKLSDKVAVAATVVMGMNLDSERTRVGEGAPSTETSTSTYVLPGVDLSLEARWKEWLTARAGLLSRYSIAKTSSTNVNAQADQEGGSVDIVRTGAEHLAAAGIGIHWDGFAIDGAFNIPFLTDGPEFLGGRGTGVLAELSFSYSWGGAPEDALPSYGPDGTAPPARPQPRYAPPPSPPPPAPEYERSSDPYWDPR